MPLLLLLSALLFSPTDIDWTKARSEAVQLLQELIRIDTTNPPGKELAAVRHIQKALDAEGIETRILDVAPGRANLYARIKGDGSKRSLVLRGARLRGFARRVLLLELSLAQRRRDAKRCRVFKGFLCAFAPLRETISPQVRVSRSRETNLRRYCPGGACEGSSEAR